MSGVWVFKNNGVMHLVKDPAERRGGAARMKVLVHRPTGQAMTSYGILEQVLKGLGWVRYHACDPTLIQFHKMCSIDLISLPKDFSKFNSIHMFDIVVKNPRIFLVRDE